MSFASSKTLSLAKTRLFCCITMKRYDIFRHFDSFVSEKGTKDLMVRLSRIAAWVLIAIGLIFCLSPYDSFLNRHVPQWFIAILPVIIYGVALVWSGLFLWARRKSSQFCGHCGNAFYQEPRCSNGKCGAKLVAGLDHCLSCGTEIILHKTRTNNGSNGDEQYTDPATQALHPTQKLHRNPGSPR